MSIDPEVIPPSSSAGKNAVRLIPKWAIYLAIGLVVMTFIGLIKTLLPLILIGAVVGVILKRAS